MYVYIYIYIYVSKAAVRCFRDPLCLRVGGTGSCTRLENKDSGYAWRKTKSISKGDFLNNTLVSYTDLYLRNEISGMCIQIICYSGK